MPADDATITRFLRGLWQLNRQLKTDLGRELEPLQLDLRRYFILGAVRCGAASPGALAEELDFPASMVSRYLDALCGAGYLGRRLDPHDSRRVLLELTPAGEHAWQAAAAAVRRCTRQTLNRLDTDVLTALLAALDTLSDPLSTAQEQPR